MVAAHVPAVAHQVLDLADLPLDVRRWRATAPAVVTSLQAQPWVHVHRLFGPDEARLLGHGVAELCCHACNSGIWVVHLGADRYAGGQQLGPEALRQRTIAFGLVHARCETPGAGKHYRARCAGGRRSLGLVDLREAAAAAGR